MVIKQCEIYLPNLNNQDITYLLKVEGSNLEHQIKSKST